MGVFGRILAIIGILLVFGLVAGLAYSAGLAAAGAVPAAGTAAPVIGYPAYGWPLWGFGFGFFHLIGLVLVFVLVFGLLRLAFGGFGGRRHGYGPGWGPGPRGWRDHEVGDHSGPGDPGEAWMRSRLDDWHRAAHQTPAEPGSSGVPDAPDGPAAGPVDRASGG